MLTKFRKGQSQGFYYVHVGGKYAGFVLKSRVDGKWSNSYNETVRFDTRKDAAAAMMPAIRAEVAAADHYANATSEDKSRSWGNSPIYIHSKATLFDAIKAAYPDMDVNDVYYGWVDSGESIRWVVNYLRQERADKIKQDAIDAAEEAAHRATREAAFLVTDAAATGKTNVSVQFVSYDIPQDKRQGVTDAGVPFTTVNVSYQAPEAAWRMVDVLTAELRRDPAPWTVTVDGTRPTDDYAGTLYAAHTHRTPPPGAKVPTYRMAGFPSLDAAVSAGYARA